VRATSSLWTPPPNRQIDTGIRTDPAHVHTAVGATAQGGGGQVSLTASPAAGGVAPDSVPYVRHRYTDHLYLSGN
jgi:hypothetical protein